MHSSLTHFLLKVSTGCVKRPRESILAQIDYLLRLSENLTVDRIFLPAPTPSKSESVEKITGWWKEHLRDTGDASMEIMREFMTATRIVSVMSTAYEEKGSQTEGDDQLRMIAPTMCTGTSLLDIIACRTSEKFAAGLLAVRSFTVSYKPPSSEMLTSRKDAVCNVDVLARDGQEHLHPKICARTDQPKTRWAAPHHHRPPSPSVCQCDLVRGSALVTDQPDRFVPRHISSRLSSI